MRATATSKSGDFRAKAIAGTHAITMAIDCEKGRRKGLMGFAFQRETVGKGGTGPQWLRSQKVFRSIVPDPKNEHDPKDPSKPKPFYTNDFPVQSFLWGDYSASPGTKYRLRILPMYGEPGALTTDQTDEIRLEIDTEKEWEQGETHGVWFNRGAIASQAFAERFGNKVPDDINDPKDPEVVWLSRGLLEACLKYIEETSPKDALRVAAYEFTYPPILNALKATLDRGIDVQIVYHDTSEDKESNEGPMKEAGLPIDDQKITYRRSKTKIPHNKFIVRLKGGTDPVEVWTGSTNFTSSGFLGQTNVGHRVADKKTAAQYLAFWEVLKTDPELADLRATTAELTPDPLEVIAKKSIAQVFSPRSGTKMLDWYGRRMLNAANSVWFTAAFGVTAKLVPPLAQARDQMRFILMEKPATDQNRKALTIDPTHTVLSYGTTLGELYTMKNGKPTARRRIKEFELDKWYFAEELYRPNNDGHVFFLHTKFLLVDPLSDDPLVCSGSANFSPGSLTANDENMLLIRGDTRVADIYMTEFDRVFRHFYFRDIANELAGAKKSDAKAVFLDETGTWTDDYFEPGHIKTNRRLMFFDVPKATWFENAAAEGSLEKKGTSRGRGKKAPAKKAPAKKTRKPAKRSGTATRKTRTAVKRRKPAKTSRTKRTSRKTPGKKTARKTTRKTARKTTRKSTRKSTRKTTRKPARKMGRRQTGKKSRTSRRR
jgi:phosphatidylserine/phosphatidylglycerophosphate/cardiolipin synthase-like enzyme